MNDAERRRIAEAAQAASPSPWSLGLVGADEAQIPPHLAHIEASDPMAIIGLLDRIEAKDAEIVGLNKIIAGLMLDRVKDADTLTHYRRMSDELHNKIAVCSRALDEYGIEFSDPGYRLEMIVAEFRMMREAIKVLPEYRDCSCAQQPALTCRHEAANAALAAARKLAGLGEP